MTEDNGDLQALQDLLDVERELTAQERQRLRALSEQVWADAGQQVRAQARRAYQVATPEDFASCVRTHLDTVQHVVLINAEVYHCPVCGRLLKDRHSPVASSLLQERGRLAAMFVEAERSPAGPERKRLWSRFRAALGLGTP